MHDVVFYIDQETQTTIQIEHNQTIPKSSFPVKTKFEIENWYSDPDFQNVWLDTNLVTSAITLYAKEVIVIHLISGIK